MEPDDCNIKNILNMQMCISVTNLFIYFLPQAQTAEMTQFPGVYISLMMITDITGSELKHLQYF